MKRLIPAAAVLLLLLTACPPPKPEVPLTEVPGGAFLASLEQRRQAFSGLKAVASVQAARKGRKRSFDTVGVILRTDRKFRIEAYDPLGRPLITLAWDGGPVQLRTAGEEKASAAGQLVLERVLGAGVEPGELAALLSGNVPEGPPAVAVRAFCGADGLCRVDLRDGDRERRAWMRPGAPGAAPEFLLESYDLVLNGQLVFRARFENPAVIAHYALPMKIVVENPGRKLSLTVEYSDADVNVPIDDRVFTLSGAETTLHE